MVTLSIVYHNPARKLLFRDKSKKLIIDNIKEPEEVRGAHARHLNRQDGEGCGPPLSLSTVMGNTCRLCLSSGYAAVTHGCCATLRPRKKGQGEKLEIGTGQEGHLRQHGEKGCWLVRYYGSGIYQVAVAVACHFADTHSLREHLLIVPFL